jgi:hypothetical protein
MKRFTFTLLVLLMLALGQLTSMFFTPHALAQVMNIVGADVFLHNGAGVFVTTANAAQEAVRIQGNGHLRMTGSSFLQVFGGFYNDARFTSERTSTVEFRNDVSDAVIQYTHTATPVTNNAFKFGRVNVVVDELNLNAPMVVMPGGEFNMSSTARKCIVTTNAHFVQLEDETPTNPVTLSVPTGTFGQGNGNIRESNYINGTLRWFASDDKTIYNFPVGVRGRGLQHMHIQPSPSSLGNHNIVMLDGRFQTASGGTKDPECGVTIFATDFMWEYHAYETRALANPTVVPQMAVPGDDYTLVLNPRGTAPTSTEISCQFNHTGDPAGVFQVLKQPQPNCFRTTTFHDIAIPGLTRFSKANPMYSDQPLAVQLLSFSVQPLDRSIRLIWSKDGQENALFYDVQRSTDLRNFQTLAAQIPARADQGSRKAEYDYIDRQVDFNTTYYYRLRQLNQNGHVEYSNILEARIEGSNGLRNTDFVLYPNPSQGTLELAVEATEARGIRIELFDLLGRRLHRQDVLLEAGTNRLDLTPVVLPLASGTYQVVIESQGQRIVQKLIRF